MSLLERNCAMASSVVVAWAVPETNQIGSWLLAICHTKEDQILQLVPVGD